MKMNDNMLFALELALWRFVRLRREGADGSINWQCGSRLKPCGLCVETVEEPFSILERIDVGETHPFPPS